MPKKPKCQPSPRATRYLLYLPSNARLFPKGTVGGIALCSQIDLNCLNIHRTRTLRTFYRLNYSTNVRKYRDKVLYLLAIGIPPRLQTYIFKHFVNVARHNRILFHKRQSELQSLWTFEALGPGTNATKVTKGNNWETRSVSKEWLKMSSINKPNY